MSDLTLGIRLTADADGFKGELKLSKEELDKFGGAGKQASEDTDKLSKNMDKASAAGSSLTSVVTKLAAILGTGLSIKGIIENTGDAQTSLVTLEARLKSTGNVVGYTTGQLAAMASQMQDVTTYGDEVVEQMQGVLLTFTNISGEVFPRAQRAVVDMAAAMKTDLASAAMQAGRALDNPAEGLTMLTRLGIAFTQSEKDTIEQMIRFGDAAEAQAIILDKLETKFGGTAAALRGTLWGAIEAAKNAFGDLLEMDKLQPFENLRQAFEDLTKTLSGEKMRQSADIMGSVIGGVLTDIVNGINDIISGFNNVMTATIRFGDTQIRVGNLVYTSYQLIRESIIDIYQTAREAGSILWASMTFQWSDAEKLIDLAAIRTKAQEQIYDNLKRQLMGGAGNVDLVSIIQHTAEAIAGSGAAAAKADRPLEMLRSRYAEIVAELDPAVKQSREYEATQKLLAEAFEKLNIPAERQAQLLAMLDEKYKSTALSGYVKAMADALEQAKLEVSLLGQADKARAEAIALLQAERAARDDYLKGLRASNDLTEEEIGLIRERAGALFENQQLLEQADLAAQQWTQIWQQASQNMVDALANGFRHGISSLRDFWSIVKDLAAQIAAALVFRPVVGTMLGGLAGLGVPGAAQAAAQGGFDVSGGFSLANLLSPSSALSGLGTWLAKSQVGQALGLSESFNLSGATLLQTTHLGDLFAEGLGAAPWGIVGNMAARMFGLKGSGNTLVDAGLGFAGSVGGGMVGAATLGTALGSAAGPVGAIIGAALAQGIASLFAGKPSAHTEAAFFDFGLNKRGQSDLGPGKDSPENRQAAETLLDTILDLKGLLEATGGTITGLNYIGVGVGNRAGTPELTLNAFGQVSQFSSAENLVAAISQQMADNLSGVPARIQQAIDGIDWSNLEAATATLTEAIAAEAAWQQTMQSIRDEIAQMTDPQQYELDRLDKVAADLREGAMGNAEDLAAIEEWFWLKRKEITDKYVVTVEDLTAANDNFAASARAMHAIIARAYSDQIGAVQDSMNGLAAAVRSWQQVADNASGWAFDLRFSTNRGSASSQVSALLPLFDQTLQKALGGDLSAAGQLKGIGDRLLEAQEKATGTTGPWHTIAAHIEDGYEQLAGKGNAQVSIAQAQLGVLEAQLAELRKLSAGVGGNAAPAGYNRGDLGSLVSNFNAALSSAGLDALDFLNTGQGAAWITARNNFIAGLTDPVLLSEQLAEAQRQAALPGWEEIGRGYEAAVRAQGRSLGIEGFQLGTGLGRTGTLARIHNEELLWSGPPIQVFNRDQSRSILSSQNDNGALAAKLDIIIGQNNEIIRLNNALVFENQQLRALAIKKDADLRAKDAEIAELKLQRRAI